MLDIEVVRLDWFRSDAYQDSRWQFIGVVFTDSKPSYDWTGPTQPARLYYSTLYVYCNTLQYYIHMYDIYIYIHIYIYIYIHTCVCTRPVSTLMIINLYITYSYPPFVSWDNTAFASWVVHSSRHQMCLRTSSDTWIRWVPSAQ